jgi:segregation and condensation protein B
MSLKARIEAVIYAAEEPVTLAQLTTLFREEALLSRPAREASEPSAQDSADAEMATPDFAGEPQPFPEPPGAAANSTPAESDAQSNPEREARSAERAVQREARDEIRRLIDELIQDYSSEDHGLEIREVAGGFRFGTRPEVHDAVRGFIRSLKPPMKLSLQALETLAVIAYKQPVTAPEIGEIRGVDTGGVLGSLIARKLITTAGRKQVIGRPILYKTTKEFLLRFGLKDLNELPSIEEFEKMATELEEESPALEAEGEGVEPPVDDLAQNEMAAVEENAEPAAEAESASGDAPTSEHTN